MLASRAVFVARRSPWLRTSTRCLSTVPYSLSPLDAATDVSQLYRRMEAKVEEAQAIVDRPLSLSEKLLFGHLIDPKAQEYEKGVSHLKLKPVRVAMQDASAQMALLQFMSTGLETAAVPATVHCDHLIVAEKGEAADVEAAKGESAEIFDFLRSASLKYGLGFWRPGSGIIHQVVLENYAFPGGLMIGTDSHTPNGGGLGMIAIGVGGVDAAEVMADLPWEVKYPRVMRVELQGELQPWTSPKDVVLHLAGKLGVKGATGFIIEYSGPGCESLSCTGMATITNMGAEMGATTSLFPYGPAMKRYLEATGRADIAKVADSHSQLLGSADSGAEYDAAITIDLSSLEPHVNGPFTPDLSHGISAFPAAARKNEWPLEVSVGLLGSCTNSSYQDMTRAASVVQQALDHGAKFKSAFTVSPGSERIRATMERDGLLDTFERAGAVVLANACGPCIGQWNRDIEPGTKNSIVASFNRNFTSRNDGNAATHNFLASPEMTVAFALSGSFEFDPRSDSLQAENGESFSLDFPRGEELPRAGFVSGRSEMSNAEPEQPLPLSERRRLEVVVKPTSERLQMLPRWEPVWNPSEGKGSERGWEQVPILVKVLGKCTTDHISAAGPWLKYKGHLENIAENTLIGAVNADSGELNSTTSALSGVTASIPEVAKEYRDAGVPWVVIADSNYGEGSAREHAAMQPRFLGGVAVVARSFARIHETNLKKQGMLPLTFSESSDYDRVLGSDRVSIRGLNTLSPGSSLQLAVFRDGQEAFQVDLQHSLTADQIEWFRHGGILNASSSSSSSTSSPL